MVNVNITLNPIVRKLYVVLRGYNIQVVISHWYSKYYDYTKVGQLKKNTNKL